MTDFSAGAGDQSDGGAHAETILVSGLQSPVSSPWALACAERRQKPFDFLADPGQIGEGALGFGDRRQQVVAARRAASGDLGREVSGRRGTRFTNRHGLSMRLQDLEKLLMFLTRQFGSPSSKSPSPPRIEPDSRRLPPAAGAAL